MKKILLLLALLGFIACSNDFEESETPQATSGITMTVKDFKWDNKQSKTTVDISPKGVFFNWAENDTVGVFPNEGAQAYFPMISGTGSNTASFTGGGWALKPSSTYVAYYPMQGKFYLDKTAIPISYEGQTQVGDALTTHLGKYDFMTAIAKTPENGNVNFDFEHLGALVELNVTLPKIGTYTSVKLICSEAVFPSLKGTVDITSAKPEIVAIGEKSKQLTIKLKDFVTSKENETVKVYFMTAPMDLTGKDIRVNVSGTYCYNGIVHIGDLLAGFAYSLKVENRPPFDGAKWVDLGLPSGILWATMNVGAAYPEDYGDYFAWGETAPKSSYDFSNSLTINKSMSDFSGNPQYDAATAYWGAPARMPKKTEIQEVADNCTITWTTQSGVNGRLVTGPNSNSIFLPAAGGWLGTELNFTGEVGYYWSSTPYADGTYDACLLDFYSDVFNFDNHWFRGGGASIRPVQSNGPMPATGAVQNITSEAADLSVSFSQVENGATYGVEYSAGSVGFQEEVIQVVNDGNYTVSLKGLKSETTYCYRAFVKWNGKTRYGDTKQFTTLQELWVDLGLPSGILWATRNVGASSSEDYGDYFAWGETTPKTSYSESNSLTYNKLMDDISGNPQYDAATVNWGVPARMPKTTEMDELCSHCIITWTIQNGVYGLLVTAPNGKSIFLPAAGDREGTLLVNNGEYSEYWSSTPHEEDDFYAYRLCFRKGDFVFHTQWYRYLGYPIRPVRNK